MDIYRDPALAQIMGKLSTTPVVEGFCPVAIVQHNGIDRPGFQQASSYFSGLGTMLCSADGRSFVVTAQHLFAVGREKNHTHARYAVMVLRESSDVMTRCLVDANSFFPKNPGLVDIAVCMVSTTSAPMITPFSQFNPGGGGVERHKDMFCMCHGTEDALNLRSLVSGENARMLAMLSLGDSGMHYYVIDYKSVPGESGMGFVDGYGNLFVLKGEAVEGVDEFNKKLRELGVIETERKGFAIVVGSLAIRK